MKESVRNIGKAGTSGSEWQLSLLHRKEAVEKAQKGIPAGEEVNGEVEQRPEGWVVGGLVFPLGH